MLKAVQVRHEAETPNSQASFLPLLALNGSHQTIKNPIYLFIQVANPIPDHIFTVWSSSTSAPASTLQAAIPHREPPSSPAPTDSSLPSSAALYSHRRQLPRNSVFVAVASSLPLSLPPLPHQHSRPSFAPVLVVAEAEWMPRLPMVIPLAARDMIPVKPIVRLPAQLESSSVPVWLLRRAVLVLLGRWAGRVGAIGAIVLFGDELV